MNSTDIKIFLEITNARNITKTAENLYLAQSTVSSRLKSLEEELGFQLIIRNRGQKNVELTPQGEEFISIAERLLLLQDEAQALSEHKRRTHLTVGGINSVNSYILPDFYARLLKNQREIGLHLLIRHTWELYDMVEAREIDVGIVNCATLYPNIHTQLLFREEFVMITPFNKGEEDGHTIHPGDLNPEYEIYQFYSPEFTQWHNFWWHPGLASVSIDNVSILEIIEYDKESWAIVPISIARIMKKRRNFTWYHISEPPPEWSCYAISHKYPRTNMASVIEQFLNDLMKFVQERESSVSKT
jgi:DNA-binding transcriptional LysR family regulator